MKGFDNCDGMCLYFACLPHRIAHVPRISKYADPIKSEIGIQSVRACFTAFIQSLGSNVHDINTSLTLALTTFLLTLNQIYGTLVHLSNLFIALWATIKDFYTLNFSIAVRVWQAE